jgi:hypothetical protein
LIPAGLPFLARLPTFAMLKSREELIEMHKNIECPSDRSTQAEHTAPRSAGICASSPNIRGSKSFVEMIRDPVYREAVKHRQAAVADSRLIRLCPVAPGKHFGEDANGSARAIA